ncbi:MAG TPA: DNA methyltransferase [Desulfosporosinus sp.]|nr:DNA methyltransferase [Desulfosporosinus sp.]
MDAKSQILKETFENEFSMHTFTRFTREFFNTIEIVNPDKKNINYLSEYAFYIASHTHVANYVDSERNRIAIFAVELRSGNSIERARSVQRNFVSRLLNGSGQDAAVVAFYNDNESRWRLSFVRLDYEFAKGRVKTKLTPAKRFSYLVGKGEPCHTAMEQLFPIFLNEQYNPNIDKIEEAFSVEAVTKGFFDKYKDKYFELKEYLDNNEQFIEEANLHQFTSEQFAKKLMGQLAFLYFLQKKGWLGVKVVPHVLNDKQYNNAFYSTNKAAKEIMPKMYTQIEAGQYKLRIGLLPDIADNDADILAGCFKAEPWGSGTKTFIRDLYTNCLKHQGKNFFDDYLEPLFYEALNHKRGDSHYYKKFNCKIPFLNGGLFEPLDNYDWKYSNFAIPDEMFSNRHIKNDEREADGILDIFDRYNFTMNEDEPLEREVAVDPEMLGKIFENLLDAKDRKSKGAFYTPREIVHYMCQESLINYLVNETGIFYEDIKEFILYGEIMKDEDCNANKEITGKETLLIPKSIFDNLREIDKALDNVKVADPAVGSGAFPLGMLSEIIRARGNITEYFVRQIPSDKKFDRKLMYQNRDPYRMKWDTIKNCIFAVDIEASAVDIAKLRLWLSLVVDQEVSSGNEDSFFANDNKDPHPLPNLDYNIMCGNSLMDEFEGVQLFDDSLLTKKQHNTTAAADGWQISLFSDTVGRMTEDLFKEQDRLFGEEDTERKSAIKKKIDKIINDIIRAKLTRDNNIEGLAKYNQSLKQKTKPYFLWKLECARIFKEKGGFDIVIGNPPYVGEKGNKEMFQAIAKTSLGKKFYLGKVDLFYFFFHLALDIGKQHSQVAFITTNYYITASGGRKLRADFKERARVTKLINFNELKIFQSALGQHNMITILTKGAFDNINVKTCVTARKGLASSEILSKIVAGNDEETTYSSFEQNGLYDGTENYIRLAGVGNEDNPIDKILNKIAFNNTLLGSICNVNIGMRTGADKVSPSYIEQYNLTFPKNTGIYVLTDKEKHNLNLSEFEVS